MAKTTRQLIEENSSLLDIKFKERYVKHGDSYRVEGLFITSIDGKTFKGAEGNKALRELVNEPLTDNFKTHIEKLRDKGKVPIPLSILKMRQAVKREHGSRAGYTMSQIRKKIKDEGVIAVKRELRKELPQKLSDSMKKKLKSVQKTWRENNVKGAGKITAKKVRYYIKNHGVKETRKMLQRRERYAKGFAYVENVEALLERLKRVIDALEIESLRDIYNSIYSKRNEITEKALKDLIDEVYTLIKLKKYYASAFVINCRKILEI